MSIDEHPKILIISNSSMRDRSQTAITLRNIFQNWPREKLMELSTSDAVSGSSKIAYYSLPNIRQPFATLAKTKFVRKVNIEMKKSCNRKIGAQNISLKHDIRQWLFSIIDRSPLLLVRDDFEAIKSFAPNVVYTMGSSVTQMKLAIRVATTFKIPIIPHFMDNWPESIQWQSNHLLRGYRKSLDYWLKRVYEHTRCALTISDEMAAEYERVTGVKHIALMNSIDCDYWGCTVKDPGSEILFVYAGGLHLNRESVLLEIAERLDMVSRKVKKACLMRVYTNSEPALLQTTKNWRSIKILKSVPNENLKEIYNSADVLILVESLDSNKSLEVFTKYSISTKTAEYLATGKPILYIGPAERTLTKYLKQNNVATVITDCENLSDAMEKIVLELGDSRILDSVLLARKNHNQKNLNSILLHAIELNF